VPYVDKVKSVKIRGFPTEVSDMARNMKMELLTFSLILFQSKNCGHRIHVLFMMYDVYWYCQMKKKRMIMKILKKEWFIWTFWKKGGSREKGEEETKSMPHAPVVTYRKNMPFSLNFAWQRTVLTSLKGNNSYNTYNFSIKFGNVKSGLLITSNLSSTVW
jgi:hypothetical protein